MLGRGGKAFTQEREGGAEEDTADDEEGQKAGPDHVEAGAAEKDGLGEGDKMRRGGRFHDELHGLRHALVGGVSAGEHLKRNDHQDHQ